jgi:6-pyruvoyl-tetrahydropterin synthase
MSKLFLHNITILDCALWRCLGNFPQANLGSPIGKSWRVDCLLTGSVDENGILFDFGQAKKHVKRIIDDCFDHRFFCPGSLVTSGDTYVEFKAKNFYLKAPSSSFVFFNDEVFFEIAENKTEGLEKHIEQYILKHSPENIKEVKITLQCETFDAEFPECEYIHSLKFHQGNCQRFHGHSNGVKVEKNGKADSFLAKRAQAVLSGKYLVAKNYNCTFSENTALSRNPSYSEDTFAHINYQGSQGTYELYIPKERVVFIDQESTIENIAEFLHKELKLTLNEKVYAFEGIGKGCVFP